MRISKRDCIVLTIFTVGVVAYAAYAIRGRLSSDAGSSSEDAKGASRESTALDDIARSRGVLAGEATILARNLFQPLIGARSSGEGETGAETAADMQTKAIPPGNVDRSGWMPAPTNKTGNDESQGEGKGAAKAGNGKGQPIKIALTAIVSSANSLLALVENEEHKTQYLKVGQEAFGYTLQYLNPRGAIFGSDGRAYVLKIGEGKTAKGPEPKKAGEGEKKPEESKGGPPGGVGGGMPSFGGMPPGGWGGGSPEEMMMKMKAGGMKWGPGGGMGGGPPGRMGRRGRPGP